MSKRAPEKKMDIIRDDRGQIIGFVKGEIVQDASGRIGRLRQAHGDF